MRMKLLFGITILIFLISFPVEGQNLGSFIKPKLQIIDFQVPDVANAGEDFFVYVTMKNRRVLPVRVIVQIELLDGLLGGKKKTIGNETKYIGHGETRLPIEINIRDGDIDWYKQKYNIQAVLFRDYTLLGRSIWRHSSSIQGIHIRSRLCEKDKVKISKMYVPEIIEYPDQDWFYVDVWVTNAGEFNANTTVRIDLIEKPSAIPGFEQLGISGFSAVRKELGNCEKILEPSSDDSGEDFIIRCDLRDIESKKEKFVIEAKVFVDIDGKEYEVDTSSSYEIFHKQPICRDEGCLLLVIGTIFAGLIAFCLLAVSIRILYPLYRIKKTRLKEEKERIDKRKH